MNITVDYVTFVLQTRLRVLWAIKENFIRHVKRFLIISLICLKNVEFFIRRFLPLSPLCGGEKGFWMI